MSHEAIAAMLKHAVVHLELAFGPSARVALVMRRVDMPDQPIVISRDDPDEIIRAVEGWKKALEEIARGIA